MPDSNQNSIDSNSEQNIEQSNIAKNTVRLDPGTLVLIIAVLLFIPLVLTGLFAH